MLDLFWGRIGHHLDTRASTIYLANVFQFLGFTATQKWKPLYYVYSAIINFGILIFMPLSFNLSFIFLFHQMSMSHFLFSLQVGINVCGIPGKFFAIKWSRHHLRAADDIMETLDERCHRRDEYRKIQNCIIFCNRASVCFAFTYLFYSLLTLMTSSLLKGQPPYSLYMFPLDWRRSSWEFMLQSSIEFTLMNYICAYQSMADSYPVIYVYIIRTHMQILVERVRRLGCEELKSNDEDYEELVECIKDHQNLLSLYNKISPVISMTIFVQFTITAALLGTTMINIFIFAETSEKITSMMYFLVVMVQTAPCCYQATCLMVDSAKLPNALLQCQWWHEDKRFKQLLLFFMHRSQKEMTLTAMKLFPITLSTNLNIAKFSFSLYTLIKKMDLDKTLKN